MNHRLALILFFTEISCKKEKHLRGMNTKCTKIVGCYLKLLYAISVAYNKEILIIPFN